MFQSDKLGETPVKSSTFSLNVSQEERDTIQTQPGRFSTSILRTNICVPLPPVPLKNNFAQCHMLLNDIREIDAVPSLLRSLTHWSTPLLPSIANQ